MDYLIVGVVLVLTILVLVQPQNYVRVDMSDLGEMVVFYPFRGKRVTYNESRIRVLYHGRSLGISGNGVPYRPLTARRNFYFRPSDVLVLECSLGSRKNIFYLNDAKLPSPLKEWRKDSGTGEELIS